MAPKMRSGRSLVFRRGNSLQEFTVPGDKRSSILARFFEFYKPLLSPKRFLVKSEVAQSVLY